MMAYTTKGEAFYSYVIQLGLWKGSKGVTDDIVEKTFLLWFILIWKTHRVW